jgi:sigma-B regulation protein RsbU (phosphoserine phosphatase)
MIRGSGGLADRLAPKVRELLADFGEDPAEEPEFLARRIEEAVGEAPGAEPDAAWVAARLLSRQLKETRFELRERALELESLYDLGLSVGSSLDLARLSDEILLRSISLTNSRSGSLHIFDEGRVILSRSFGGELLMPEAALRLDLKPEGIINNCARALPTSGIFLSDCEKCLVVPIQFENKGLGILAVADKETRDGAIRDFFPSDARLLMLFASHAATAIETARLHREALDKERIDRELEVAATIQREILPRETPSYPGVTLAARNRSTRQVGGDYFDFFSLSGERFAFAVGDVSGKGVPAALLVSTLASAIHLQIEQSKTVPELVERVHRHLMRFSRARKFSTLFFGLMHTDTGELRYVSAGHNPAILRRAGGVVEELGSTGRPVGMFWESSWTESIVRLEPGDRLCVYTDGITEAQNAGQEDFGLPRLSRILAETAEIPVAHALERILDDVAAFAGETPQYDDQTLLLLAR